MKSNGRTLLYHISSADQAWARLESGGKPVWPLASPEEIGHLSAVCELLGIEMEAAEAVAINHEPHPGEKVIALGKALEREALLYAHLTGRTPVTVLSADELRGMENIAVVILTHEQMSAGLLTLLYQEKKGDAPGLIFAYSAPGLRMQVLHRAAVAFFSQASPNERVVEFIQQLPVTHYSKKPSWDMYGGISPNEIKRAAMKSSPGLLHVLTHSDGIDANFGGLVLCPYAAETTELSSGISKAPLCLVNGICYRCNEPVEKSREEGKLLDPADIAARIMVFSVCNGIMLPTSGLEAKAGLFPGLLRNPSLGAIVTSWEIVLVGPEATESLVNAIHEGAQLGRALGQFNRKSGKGLLFCLVGDPRSALCPPAEKKTPRLFASSSTEQDSAGNRLLAKLNMLRIYLAEQLDRTNGSLEEETRACLALLNEYEIGIVRRKNRELLEEDTGGPLRDHFIRYIFMRGSYPALDWLMLSKQLKEHTKEHCYICKAPLRIFDCSLRTPQSGRLLANCPNCGFIFDVSSGSGLEKIRIETGVPGEIKIQFSRTSGAVWSAGLLMSYRLKSLNKAWAWPRDENGQPETELRAEGPFPEGPFELCFLLIDSDGNWGLIKRPARGESINVISCSFSA